MITKALSRQGSKARSKVKPARQRFSHQAPPTDVSDDNPEVRLLHGSPHDVRVRGGPHCQVTKAIRVSPQKSAKKEPRAGSTPRGDSPPTLLRFLGCWSLLGRCGSASRWLGDYLFCHLLTRVAVGTFKDLSTTSAFISSSHTFLSLSIRYVIPSRR